MACKLCACIPLVTYCIKCQINCFKCRLLVVMHGPPTAMKYVGPASFRSFAHTHIHTMIRPVIPLTGVNIKLICNNMDALVFYDKNQYLIKKNICIKKVIKVPISITGISAFQFSGTINNSSKKIFNFFSQSAKMLLLIYM